MLNPILPSVDSDLDTAHPKQLAFETKCVKRVLTKFGLSDKEESMRLEADDEYMRNHARPKPRSARPQLTFAVFHKVFPTFPVVLEAHSFYGTTADPRFHLTTLMRSFQHSLIYQQYLDLYTRDEAEAGGRPVGMVFPYQGYHHGLIAHNALLDVPGPKVVYPMPGGIAPVRIVIEPFERFLTFLAKGGWRSNEDPRNPVPLQKPATLPGFRVEPWMVRHFGKAGGAVLLLAFLMHVLLMEDGDSGELVRRTAEGTCVVATHAELEQATGLVDRQFDRAVSALRKKKFIETELLNDEGVTKTRFWLDWDAVG